MAEKEIIGRAAVVCMNARCRKYVGVKVWKDGDIYKAVCPMCGELAYNAEEPPRDMERIK